MHDGMIRLPQVPTRQDFAPTVPPTQARSLEYAVSVAFQNWGQRLSYSNWPLLMNNRLELLGYQRTWRLCGTVIRLRLMVAMMLAARSERPKCWPETESGLSLDSRGGPAPGKAHNTMKAQTLCPTTLAIDKAELRIHNK